jgi:hypothetical protein
MSSSRRSELPRRGLALAGCLLLLVAGCSTLRVKSDYDKEFDFSRLHTFTWLDPPVRSEPESSPMDDLVDPFARNSILDKRVRQAVERELLARGYRKGGDGRAEFQLQYFVIIRDRTKIRSYPRAGYGYYGGPYRYGYGAGWGGVSSYNYKEGTLILDVIDSRTNLHRREGRRGGEDGARPLSARGARGRRRRESPARVDGQRRRSRASLLGSPPRRRSLPATSVVQLSCRAWRGWPEVN